VTLPLLQGPPDVSGGASKGNGLIVLEFSEQFLVLTCRDEQHQVEPLARFQEKGLEYKVLVG